MQVKDKGILKEVRKDLDMRMKGRMESQRRRLRTSFGGNVGNTVGHKAGKGTDLHSRRNARTVSWIISFRNLTKDHSAMGNKIGVLDQCEEFYLSATQVSY